MSESSCCFSGKYFDFLPVSSGLLTTFAWILPFFNGAFFSAFDFSVAFRVLGFLAPACSAALEARLFSVAGGSNSRSLTSSGIFQIEDFSTFPLLPWALLPWASLAFAAKALNMALGEGGNGEDRNGSWSFMAVVGGGECRGSGGDERRLIISLTGTGSLVGIVVIPRVDRSSSGRTDDSHLYGRMDVFL